MRVLDPEAFMDKVKAFTLLRRQNSQDHPKLISMSDLESPLKPVLFMDKCFSNLCKEKHNHEKSSQDCYLYYLEKCVGKEFYPTDFIMSDRNLMAGVPVLDHINSQLIFMDDSDIGGSWFTWLQNKVAPIPQHRQISMKSNQIVRSLRLGRSSNEEVELFKSNMDRIYGGEKRGSLVPFRVAMIKLADDKPSLVKCKGVECKIFCGSLPGVIYFGDHTFRYQIIIPWKPYNINKDTNEGNYTLDLNEPVDSCWYSLLNSLPFIPFLLKPEEIESVEWLFNDLVVSVDQNSKVLLGKYATLGMLLSLSGWDLPCSNLSVVNFVLTGGLLNRFWKAETGFGKWGMIPMSKANNLFLIGELYGMQNALTVLSAALLLHWFPSPVISYTISQLEPVQFSSWFHKFLADILSNCRFKGDLMQTYQDMKHVPGFTSTNVEFLETSAFCLDIVISMIPSWSNVTSGGPSSLGRILKHSVEVVQPIFLNKDCPRDLKWPIQPTQVENLSRLGLKSLPSCSQLTSCFY